LRRLQCHDVCVSDWDENLTEDQARKAYDKMLKIEEEFGNLFTGLIIQASKFVDAVMAQYRITIKLI